MQFENDDDSNSSKSKVVLLLLLLLQKIRYHFHFDYLRDFLCESGEPFLRSSEIEVGFVLLEGFVERLSRCMPRC
jgi:hypothetical protein